MNAKARRWVAVFGCLVAACNLTQPEPSVEPTSVSSTPIASAPTTQRFEAPGISFDYPAEWVDQSALVPEDPRPGRRHIATFTLGMSVCPRDEETEWSEQGPASCSVEPQLAGDLRFDVSELMDLYPDTRPHAGDIWLAGDVLNQQWSIENAEQGELRLRLRTRAETFPDRSSSFQVRMREVIASVTTTSWQSPPPARNGVVTQSLPQGFSFRYPVGWSRYFPWPTGNWRSIVSVSSKPLPRRPSCAVTVICWQFQVAPDSLLVEFLFVQPQTFINWDDVWADASASLGGQPASKHVDQLTDHATGADELVTWRVRLPGETWPLHIHAWLRGPDLEIQRAALESLLETLVIEAKPQTT
jgi:hypothetical protein